MFDQSAIVTMPADRVLRAAQGASKLYDARFQAEKEDWIGRQMAKWRLFGRWNREKAVTVFCASALDGGQHGGLFYQSRQHADRARELIKLARVAHGEDISLFEPDIHLLGRFLYEDAP